MQKIIKNTGKGQRRINIIEAGKALGGEKAEVKVDTKQGPVSLFSLRQFLINNLRSSGGRPALEGKAKKRNKIPLLEEDWHKLKLIADYYRKKEGINVTPGQIASILLHKDIAGIKLKDTTSL